MGVFLIQLGLFVSFIVLVLASLVLGACILAAPVTAVVCGVVARLRGLAVWRYALAGGLYSMMFFLPVVYLAHEMYDRKTDPYFVKVGLAAAYVTWFTAAVVGPFYFIVAFGESPADSPLEQYAGAYRFLPWLSAGTLIASILWIVIDRKLREPDNPYDPVPEETTLTRVMYLAPFALAGFWVFLTSFGMFGLEIVGLRLPWWTK